MAPRGLLLLKRYLLALPDDAPFPLVSDKYMDAVLKTVCQSPGRGRPPGQVTAAHRSRLTAFYAANFARLLADGDGPITYYHLNSVLGYTATELVTNLEVNIKEHYIDYVQGYVAAILDEGGLDKKNMNTVVTHVLGVGGGGQCKQNGRHARSVPRGYDRLVGELRKVAVPGKTTYWKDSLR
jgi:hypothetical protein